MCFYHMFILHKINIIMYVRKLRNIRKESIGYIAKDLVAFLANARPSARVKIAKRLRSLSKSKRILEMKIFSRLHIS